MSDQPEGFKLEDILKGVKALTKNTEEVKTGGFSSVDAPDAVIVIERVGGQEIRRTVFADGHFMPGEYVEQAAFDRAPSKSAVYGIASAAKRAAWTQQQTGWLMDVLPEGLRKLMTRESCDDPNCDNH